MVKIRPIDKSDLFSVFEILQQISLFLPRESDYAKYYDNFISSNCYGVVAEYLSDGKTEIVGFGSIALSPRIRGGISGYIEDISVKDNFKRNGIGSMIILNLINYAKNNKCYKITLESKEINLEFYKSLGFKTNGISLNKYFSS